MNRERSNFLIRIAVVFGLLSAILIVLYLLDIPRAVRIALLVAGWLYFLFCLVALLLWIDIIMKKRLSITSDSGNVLIVSPHQDDCVAIAGGYAIQTLEKGGRVTVLYVTGGYPNDRMGRKQEAINAWSVVGLGEKNLHFMEYDSSTGLTSKDEIESCIDEMNRLIRKWKPKTIFVPLYEGGHYQHDVTNYMLNRAVRESGLKAKIWEAPEYNFYFSIRTTPEKILSGFARCIPFLQYDYPPEPVRRDPVYYLAMKPDQVELKKKMLSKFTTQQPENLIVRFGFEDRFQKLHDYDYNQPPFRYERSLARLINFMKSLPIIGKRVSKMVRWTKTIHADPNYVMTRIPL